MIPFDEEALPSYEHIHAHVPAELLPTADLVHTQPDVHINHLLHLHRGGSQKRPDPALHVVRFEGRDHVYDGHHRWVRALLRDQLDILGRVVHLDSPAALTYLEDAPNG